MPRHLATVNFLLLPVFFDSLAKVLLGLEGFSHGRGVLLRLFLEHFQLILNFSQHFKWVIGDTIEVRHAFIVTKSPVSEWSCRLRTQLHQPTLEEFLVELHCGLCTRARRLPGETFHHQVNLVGVKLLDYLVCFARNFDVLDVKIVLDAVMHSHSEVEVLKSDIHVSGLQLMRYFLQVVTDQFFLLVAVVA